VGSTDLGAPTPDRASGLLRAELAELGCPLVDCAETARLGEVALTVDRHGFAEAVAATLNEQPGIELVREEARALPEGVVVVATGPATWTPLARQIYAAAGVPYSFGYWGRAPLLLVADSAPLAAIRAPAYPGADGSLFVPLDEAEMAAFIEALASGEREAPPGLGEAMLADETPLAEDLAAGDLGRLRGQVLSGPRGGDRMDAPAALRLVPEDADGLRYALADVVTALTREAQESLLGTVAALRDTELIRPGGVHRLPVLAPGSALLGTLQLVRSPSVLVAGTLVGGLGYSEAMATGWVAGQNAARLAAGGDPVILPKESLTGELCRALTSAEAGPGGLVQANFGMLPEVPGDDDGKDARRARQIEGALEAARQFAGE